MADHLEFINVKCDVHVESDVPNTQCSICTREDETVKHILWSCLFTPDVWGNGTKKFQKSFCERLTFYHVLEEMLRRCEEEDLELLAVAARKIWFRRNFVVHGGNFIHLN